MPDAALESSRRLRFETIIVAISMILVPALHGLNAFVSGFFDPVIMLGAVSLYFAYGAIVFLILGLRLNNWVRGLVLGFYLVANGVEAYSLMISLIEAV